MAIGAIFGVARAEALRLVRTPVALSLLLVVPMIELVLFGTAIRPTHGDLLVAIAAENPASLSRAVKEVGGVQGVRIMQFAKAGDAEAALRSGKAQIAVEIPEARSFANPLASGGPLRVIADGREPALIEATLARLEAVYWRGLAVQSEVDGNGPGLKVNRLYNPAARADWGFLPALIGVTVMISMVMLGSLQLAREREGGTYETMVMLPLSRIEMLIARLIPYLLVGFAQGVSVLLLAVMIFDLPVAGSVAALLLLLIPFTTAHYVLGLAIAGRAATQLAAIQGAVAFYLPAMLLSGFLYPFRSLPRWAQHLGDIFPLTHFIRAARGATLGGETAPTTLMHGLPILGFVAVVVIAAIQTSGERLD